MSDATSLEALPESWVVWNDEDGGRVVLVFRPDVFDGDAYPPACLPTIYVSRRPPEQRMRRATRERSSWYLSMRLEPDVRVRGRDGEFETRADAVAGAVQLAGAFAAGDVAYREAYQVPREDYLDALDELTG